jgi:hypothetical protein
MDKKSLLVNPDRITKDRRAIVLKFRYIAEAIEFLNLLKLNILNFEYRYFYKFYYFDKNDVLFIKNIGNILKNTINEEKFKLELIIVGLKNNSIHEIFKFMDNETSIINYKKGLFSNIKKEGF